MRRLFFVFRPSRDGHAPLLVLALACALWLVLAAPPAKAQERGFGALAWMTEEYFPYNFSEHGEIKGISTDLLRLTWKELGEPEHRIHTYPWARAYHFAQTEPNTVLFSMARIPERETLFQWAGPIATVRFVLAGKKTRGFTIRQGSDLKGLTIGTLRQDVGDALLAPWADLCLVEPVADMMQNLGKLEMDRLDLVAYEENSLRLLMLRHGMDPDRFETVFVLNEIPVYFAFHRDTDQNLVRRFQEALDRVKATASFTDLVDRYAR